MVSHFSGNASDTVTFIDKRNPDKTFQVEVGKGTDEPAVLTQKLADELGKLDTEFTIKFENLKTLGGKGFYFTQKPTFKEIVFAQKADGEWSKKLLTQIDIANIEALKAMHTSPKSLKNLSDGQVLTLVGIRVLQKHFSQDRKLWKLIVDKAKLKLAGQGITNIDNLVNKFKI